VGAFVVLFGIPAGEKKAAENMYFVF
jgi:hypothetical protein